MEEKEHFDPRWEADLDPDVKGQSIVSHITRCIGTLKTLSN